MNSEAFFKITYGLYVVSSSWNNKRNGYISNTVFQVTSEPAQFAIACSKNNFSTEIIRNSKNFAISVLKKETRNDVIGTFGYKTGRDIDKFENFDFKTSQSGAPILLTDTIAWFDCRVLSEFDMGTHILFIGEVLDGDVIDITGEPLTYAYYREVKKGKAPKNAPTYLDPEKLKKQPVKEEVATDLYYCTACGHIYDPALGDPDSGIAPGTKFEDLPDDWHCPVCGADKSDFALKE